MKLVWILWEDKNCALVLESGLVEREVGPQPHRVGCLCAGYTPIDRLGIGVGTLYVMRNAITTGVVNVYIT